MSRILHFLAKILKDPSFSCQDPKGSFIFLPRSSRILHFLAKILKDPSFSCQDPQVSPEDLAKILMDCPKILERPSRILPKSCKFPQGFL